ncbi:mechanosensitive ion channel family protein [Sphingobacterium psychroaquaticum]|uniref:Miniconductance mechanosensitive channel n=1 Tax=Sphingobacterium psychroaquaticum TaxID=561061 RepID=A0A1X7L4K1_9SPHI|nr:mechanosensitive ion channel domain-containing protein [Sphingobacterium psychroaquaticum]QBQ42242.1 mechanosensitive ion channel [Sphingobacterium psychroaquaticum]SMG48557.1 miniconductance mechanosensitive channel [Sphingobacterium psychroaquaticum]
MEDKDFIVVDAKRNSKIFDWALDYVEKTGLHGGIAQFVTSFLLLIAITVGLLIVDFIVRKILRSLFVNIIKRTKTLWDDLLIEHKVLDNLSHIVPLMIAQQLLPVVFIDSPIWSSFIFKTVTIFIVFVIYRLINGFLKTLRDILREKNAFIDKPLDSYLQVVQIFLIFIGLTFVFSIVTGSSPWEFLISLGAASAIFMLVFKDTILGFVASIQVSANDSVRVGDWIEMTKYGADGTVLQINLNNVKVQNFDKTIVTIPTHTLLTDSFKNYRGMQQFGGRRIKRAISIKISSIRYLTDEEINELKKIKLLKDYIEERQQEIAAYNEETQNDPRVMVNGRRITNVGTFRAYITRYAQNNPNIHQDRMLMVRQLPPDEHGLPLELYMFTTSTEWTFFENVMADIFDHLFAAIKFFHLEVFELPASDDLRGVMNKVKELEK